MTEDNFNSPIPLIVPEFIYSFPSDQSFLKRASSKDGISIELFTAHSLHVLSKILEDSPIFKASISFKRELPLPLFKNKPLNINDYPIGFADREPGDFSTWCLLTSLSDPIKYRYSRMGELRAALYFPSMAVTTYNLCPPEMCGEWSAMFELIEPEVKLDPVTGVQTGYVNEYSWILVGLTSRNANCERCGAREVGKIGNEKLGQCYFQQCTGCKKARYCNVKCQRMDWPMHKLSCKS